MSAQPCGCDEAVSHLCARHAHEASLNAVRDRVPILEEAIASQCGEEAAILSTAGRLPTGSAERKTYPIGTGVLDYFPDAIAAIAHVSYLGNEQHNPGEPLHWARGKSMDQADTMLRHFLERGTMDTDGTRHSAKMAWRALAILQLEIEADRS